MSTSLLYHAIGLVGYNYMRTRYAGYTVIFSVRQKKGKRIAINEILVHRKHRHLMVVDMGALIFIGDGKGGKALEPFWRRLKRYRVRIKTVVMCMLPAYISAVSSHRPYVIIVFDHFHIAKLFNDKLTELS